MFYNIYKSNFALISLLFVLVLSSCGVEKKPLEVGLEPILNIVSKQKEVDYSIVLNDMDVIENDVNIIYRHKYMIINPQDSLLKIDSTDWENVSEGYFQKNEKNLGMELLSRHDGVTNTVPKPLGFDWAVGNPEYGDWVEDTTAVASTSTGGTSTNRENDRVWRYHSGSNFFLMYMMFSRPIYYGSYRGYGGYRGRAPYYGSGSRSYGTNSSYQRTNRSGHYSRKASSKSWSSYGKRSSTKSSGSSSRYKGGSSTRGRSGGFGK